jgi:hypothetical protein
MIPLAVPIAFAVLAVVAWRYDARARRAYEATLSAAEKRQFRALRRVRPANWRAAIALKQAETAVAASPVVDAGAPDTTSVSSNRPRRAKRDGAAPRRRKTSQKKQ